MAKTSTAMEVGQEGSLREGLETAIRERVREIIEMVLQEEMEAALGLHHQEPQQQMRPQRSLSALPKKQPRNGPEPTYKFGCLTWPHFETSPIDLPEAIRNAGQLTFRCAAGSEPRRARTFL
jgi:hypothetical protein